MLFFSASVAISAPPLSPIQVHCHHFHVYRTSFTFRPHVFSYIIHDRKTFFPQIFSAIYPSFKFYKSDTSTCVLFLHPVICFQCCHKQFIEIILPGKHRGILRRRWYCASWPHGTLLPHRSDPFHRSHNLLLCRSCKNSVGIFCHSGLRSVSLSTLSCVALPFQFIQNRYQLHFPHSLFIFFFLHPFFLQISSRQHFSQWGFVLAVRHLFRDKPADGRGRCPSSGGTIFTMPSLFLRIFQIIHQPDSGWTGGCSEYP